MAYALYAQNRFLAQHTERQPFDWKVNKWYQLKIVAKGSRFKYYIDGKLVIDYKDEAHSTGKVGIGNGYHSTIYYYDDFMITGDQVPDLNLSVSPQSKLATIWARLKLIRQY